MIAGERRLPSSGLLSLCLAYHSKDIVPPSLCVFILILLLWEPYFMTKVFNGSTNLLFSSTESLSDLHGSQELIASSLVAFLLHL